MSVEEQLAAFNGYPARPRPYWVTPASLGSAVTLVVVAFVIAAVLVLA